MAKKKKKKPAKKQPAKKPESGNDSSFWQLAGAIILILAGFFMLLGGFGAGGKLPEDLFSGADWLIGWSAFIAPFALVFFGVHKFQSEDRQIPLVKFISMSGFLVASAATFHVLFSSNNQSRSPGGAVGEVAGDLVLKVLDTVPATIFFMLFAVLAFFLAFDISPRALLLVKKLFEKGEGQKDTDLEALKTKGEGKLKLNEGVPTERTDDNAQGRLSSLKNTAEKLTAGESHEALTTASDSSWKLPSIELLNRKQDKADAGDIEGNAKAIQETLTNFNIKVDMEGANVGPRVTQYTLKPPTGVKLTKITALENNLALDLAAHSIRMEAPIPGKRLVGVEVPNKKSAIVRISGMLSSNDWQTMKSPLSLTIGRDIAGSPILGDLSQMPHLLVAGQTGSGKSVMINSILTSLLYRNSPADLRLILVDPKQVEMNTYNDIPHLLTPVVHEPEKCISSLKWAVAEMERRLKALSEAHTRNIAEYNNQKKEEGMPYIVIVIDELADLMMLAARDVESLIVRLAQKARAVGIHLVLATQRPSVDIITGLIKANVPARIAFTTASQVDSRTIIDQGGAEKLLGRGDMLFLTSDMPKPKRIQGSFISDAEMKKVADFIREQRLPEYDEEVVSQPVQLGKGRSITMDAGNADADDELWQDAVSVVVEGRKASTSLLQRRLRIGYARAARLIEAMEEQGIVGPADGSRPREVLISSLDEAFGGSQTAEQEDVYDDMPDEPEDDKNPK
jgi:S-DNA-T family DNA segregation ATPase FtsK/SpoIIIE